MGVASRVVSRILVSIGLLLASAAWSGWVLLHTAADPTRAERVATAVLHDPDARHEVARDVTHTVVDTVLKLTQGKLPTSFVGADDPRLIDAVDGALADPRLIDNVVTALGNAHARALGVTAPEPVVDGAALVNGVVQRLEPVAPDQAAIVRTFTIGNVTLPSFTVPYAKESRDLADRWVPRLAAGAAVLLLAALAVGNRAGVLRAVGLWAIGAAIFWVAVPRLIVWIARTQFTGHAAVVAVGTKAATASLAGPALLLGGAGLVALVVGVAAGLALDRRPAPVAAGRAPARRPVAGAVGGPVPSPARATAPAPATAARVAATTTVAGASPTTAMPQQPPPGPGAPGGWTPAPHPASRPAAVWSPAAESPTGTSWSAPPVAPRSRSADVWTQLDVPFPPIDPYAPHPDDELDDDPFAGSIRALLDAPPEPEDDEWWKPN